MTLTKPRFKLVMSRRGSEFAMKKYDWFLGLILGILLASGTSFALGSGQGVGQLGLVEGEVFVDAKPVKKNAPVRQGSVIEVRKGNATFSRFKNARQCLWRYANGVIGRCGT